MEQTKFWVIAKRFIRGLVYSTVPIILIELNKGYDLSNSVDQKRLVSSLTTPLIIGLLMALDKWVRWEEPEEPVEIEELSDVKIAAKRSKK